MSISVKRGEEGYDTLRTRYFNARVPDWMPSEIVCPTTTAEVAEAVRRAKRDNRPIGVRSGGHLFPCCSLVQDGLLVDTKKLNSKIEYDPETELLCFSPGCTSRDMAEACSGIDRFFPFGHSPSVGTGGFLLCGGQGWFMRGWGNSADSWIPKFEIVTADGEVVEASRETNSDLFWAARGSGQGFFGVVTRIWARTIPARRLFQRALVFNATANFEQICQWIFDANDTTPAYGVETAFVTFHPDKDEPLSGDDVRDTTLLLAVQLLTFTDSIDEAAIMIREYDQIPAELQSLVVANVPLEETTWARLFTDQAALNPTGHAERWQCDSILDDPQVPRGQLIKAMKPAMCDLPSRRSVGCVYIADYFPDEQECAISLPQHYYISTMTCWTDPARDTMMRRWMHDTYKTLSHVGVGQYIADFDATHRLEKVMTPSALRKWLQIRTKWDPCERFPGYNGFSSTLDPQPSP